MKTRKLLSMNNNMFKVILLVAIFATQVPLVFAQESTSSAPVVTFQYSSGAPMEVGDSVTINPDSLRYITGERMSTWVYDVTHTIRQLGTKTKPTGVLLRGINSWIAQGSLNPENVEKQQATIDRKKAEAAAAEAAAAAAAAAEIQEEYIEEVIEEVVEEVVEDTLPPAPQPFQINRFSVGVRGGLASLLPTAEPTLGATWGFDALLDLQYAHYWAKADDKIRLGLMTGVSIGYMQNSKTMNGMSEYSEYESEGIIKYEVTADEVSVVNRQLQLEVPLMFSMITPGGFFLNVGPKFILPVYTPYTQTLTNTNIKATLPEYGVTIPNEIVTGKLAPEYTHKGMNNHQFDLTIAVGGELGYEHSLESGHSISVGLYANYGVYSTYKHYSNDPLKHAIVLIDPPTAQGVATITTNSMNNAYVNKLSYLDAGLKVTFHLNWKK